MLTAKNNVHSRSHCKEKFKKLKIDIDKFKKKGVLMFVVKTNKNFEAC